MEDICHSDDPAEQIDLISLDAVRISAAIQALMVLQGYQGLSVVDPRRLLQEFITVDGMFLHLFVLFIGQLIGLIQDRLRDQHFAHIVQQRCCCQLQQLLLIQAKPAAEHVGECADSDVMPIRIIILRLKGGE